MTNDFYYINDTSSAVSELQIKLRLISEYDSDIPMVLQDGIYGEETRGAVTIFQNKNGMPPTGVMNFETFKEIDLQYQRLIKQTDNSGNSLDFSNLANNVISRGERSEYVTALKLLLSKLSERDERFETDTDDYFDEITESSVRLLQEIFGYPQTGEVDLALWKDINALVFRME